jgi:5-methylcytosine-specific restriction protein A
MTPRQFRTEESYAFEQVTRGMLTDYLRDRGFQNVIDRRKRYGRNVSQSIIATTPWGAAISMRVRLCWRPGRDGSGGQRSYSAAQLLAGIEDGDWEGSLRAKTAREAELGISHFLLVQREDGLITFAALLPLSAILPIWCAQRDTSARLIAEGRLGRQTKNHAMNGSSPTLYLWDDRAPEVASALWEYPGVQDLAVFPATADATREEHGAAGFGSAAENRMVEQTAINLVRSRYEDEGWNVRSVERDRCGFDLECTRGEEQEHVEVKGIRGSEQAFLITAGEVARAKADPRFVLMVVTHALSGSPAPARYSASEFLAAFELSAIQYRATLRSPAPGTQLR